MSLLGLSVDSTWVCFHLFPSTRSTKVINAFPSTYEVRNPHQAACYASVLLILRRFLTRQFIKHTAFLSASQINTTTRESACLIGTIIKCTLHTRWTKLYLIHLSVVRKYLPPDLKICISPPSVEEEDNAYPTFSVACKLGLGVNSANTP